MIAYVLPLAASAEPLPTAPARWKRAPSVHVRALAYPGHAAARRLAGRATLERRINDIGAPSANVVVECSIQRRGVLGGCVVQKEDPVGKGFGESALTLMSRFKMQVVDAYGFKVEGRRIRVPLRMSPVAPPNG